MTKKTITIVGFGDSITLASRQADEHKWLQVLGILLEHDVPGADLTMVNSGVGGNTSREGLARIASDVVAHRPDWVLIQFGGNDATPDQARHVSLDEYGTNLERIRAIVLSETSAQLAMLTFPPIVEEWHARGNDEFYRSRGGQDAFVERYREVTRDFARRHGLLLADIDLALRQAADRDGNGTYILPDGVHLTTDGNQIVAQTVHAALAPVLR